MSIVRMTLDVAATGCLAFEGAMTIRTAEAVLAKLSESIEQYGSILIDCSAVTEVDLSFIQLLIASRISAQLSSKKVMLAAPADGALLSALTRGGFRVSTEDQTGEATTFWFEGAAA